MAGEGQSHPILNWNNCQIPIMLFHNAHLPFNANDSLAIQLKDTVYIYLEMDIGDIINTDY